MTPRPKITVSTETTYVTEPLRPDGYVDYLGAINRRCSEGVTPENNAALPFCQAFGPKVIGDATRRRFFEALGIGELPDGGPYLVANDVFFRQHHGLKPSTLDLSDGSPAVEEEVKRFEQAQRCPWSPDQFPALAALLERNRGPLQLFVEGSRRPRFFTPLLGKDDESLVAVEFSALPMAFREAARQLRARAMFQLGEGRVDDAWDDALTCHRLARLAGQGPIIVDALIASSLESLAACGSVALIQHTDVTAEQAKQWQADLHSLPHARKIGDYWNYAERLYGLAEITDAALHGCPDWPEADPDDPFFRDLQEYLGQSNARVKMRRLFCDDPRIDWDEAHRQVNRCYDRIAGAFGEPTRPRQEQAFSRVVGEAEERYQRAMEQASRGDRLPPEMTPETIARQFVDLVWHPTFQTAQATLVAAGHRDVFAGFTALSLALAAHLHECGSYPASLAELCPKYIADVPKDPFSDGEFLYRREEDGYLLYSVGRNGNDDGGRNFWQEHENWSEIDSPSTEEEQSWDDIAIRTPKKTTNH
jgi:hypothetical protein